MFSAICYTSFLLLVRYILNVFCVPSTIIKSMSTNTDMSWAKTDVTVRGSFSFTERLGNIHQKKSRKWMCDDKRRCICAREHGFICYVTTLRKYFPSGETKAFLRKQYFMWDLENQELILMLSDWEKSAHAQQKACTFHKSWDGKGHGFSRLCKKQCQQGHG